MDVGDPVADDADANMGLKARYTFTNDDDDADGNMGLKARYSSLYKRK